MAIKIDFEGIAKFIQMNPVLIRGIVTTFAAVAATVLGHVFISDEAITTIVDGMVAVSGLVAALWSRGKVIAENKVIAWNPDPSLNEEIVAGLATVTDVSKRVDELIKAASVSQSQTEYRKAA